MSTQELLYQVISDPKLLASIQDAITHTLQVHTNSRIQAGNSFVRTSSDQQKLGVVGLVRIQCPNGSAVLAVGFSENAFLQVYKNTFREDLGEITLETADLAGEIVNIVFQIIDPVLRSRGLEFEVSFPETMIGPSLELPASQPYAKSVVLPFQAGNDQFYFEIAEASCSANAAEQQEPMP